MNVNLLPLVLSLNLYFFKKHITQANPFQANVVFSYRNQSLVVQSNPNDWFLYEMQHWAEMG